MWTWNLGHTKCHHSHLCPGICLCICLCFVFTFVFLCVEWDGYRHAIWRHTSKKRNPGSPDSANSLGFSPEPIKFALDLKTAMPIFSQSCSLFNHCTNLRYIHTNVILWKENMLFCHKTHHIFVINIILSAWLKDFSANLLD